MLPGQAVPGDGVYATLVDVNGRIYLSLTNVGMNPTFGNANRTVESYLFDLRGDLYGREIKIEFVHKIRDEIKFNNPGQLTLQINQDIQQAKEMLKVEAIAKHG